MELSQQHTKNLITETSLPAKFVDVVSLHPGKSAEVYRATNSLTGTSVFLKKYEIPDQDLHSALKEPHLLRELEHENLAKIYSADVIDESHLLLEMEFASGGSFKDFIASVAASSDWPSVHKCIGLVTDVASGLSHLAGRGFVHRDVKPANLVIRLTDSGQTGIVTDLGLVAKLDTGGRAFATKHSRLYRPPEVWQGNGYSRSSDVYQLGIVLFELLGGQLNHQLINFDDGHIAALAASSKIVKVESLTADVGPALRKVIKTATANEDKRYPTMQDFMLDLARAKQKEHDWKFEKSDTGFSMSRKDLKTFYKVIVERDNQRAIIRRYKGKVPTKLRKINPDIFLPPANLETSKIFRESLHW